VLGKTVRQHVGGRWAISWLYYLINFPLVVFNALHNSTNNPNGSFASWLLIGLLGYFCFGLVFVLANFTLFRHRRVKPVPITWVICLGILAGSSRWLVVTLLPNEWGFSNEGPEKIAMAVLTGAILGGVFVPLTALIFSVIATYLNLRSTLVGELTALHRSTLQNIEATKVLRMAIMDEATSQIVNAASARALSHDLWEGKEKQRRLHLGWFKILQTALLRNPYQGAAVSIIWSISVIRGLTVAIGFPLALTQVVCSGILIFIIYKIASRFAFVTNRGRIFSFCAVMLLTVIVTGPLASLIFDERGIGEAWDLILFNSIWLPLLTIWVSLFSSAIRTPELILQDLKERIRAEEVAARASSDQRREIQREVAESLHDMASRIHTSKSLTGAELNIDFGDLLDPPQDLDSPTDIINKALNDWASIMSIEVHMDLGACDSQGAVQIRRVVQEGLANSYRHGNATSCKVLVSFRDDQVDINVSDNGVGLPTNFTTGLGSVILESICGENWSLTSSPSGGCTLTATVSLEH